MQNHLNMSKEMMDDMFANLSSGLKDLIAGPPRKSELAAKLRAMHEEDLEEADEGTTVSQVTGDGGVIVGLSWVPMRQGEGEGGCMYDDEEKADLQPSRGQGAGLFAGGLYAEKDVLEKVMHKGRKAGDIKKRKEGMAWLAPKMVGGL